MIASCDSPTIVVAGENGIRMDSGAVVQFTATKDSVKVRNLCDTSKNAVQILSGNKTLTLAPGQEAVIGIGKPATACMSADRVARRRVHEHASDLATAEFSLPTLIGESAVMHDLFNQADDQSRALSQKVLKTSVALSSVTAGHGAFARVWK
jgi:hypothetical protein